MSVRSTARKFIKIRKVVGKAHDGASRKPEKHQEKEEQSWHGRNDAMVEQIQLVAKACYFSRKRVVHPEHQFARNKKIYKRKRRQYMPHAYIERICHRIRPVKSDDK